MIIREWNWAHEARVTPRISFGGAITLGSGFERPVRVSAVESLAFLPGSRFGEHGQAGSGLNDEHSRSRRDRNAELPVTADRNSLVPVLNRSKYSPVGAPRRAVFVARGK